LIKAAQREPYEGGNMKVEMKRNNSEERKSEKKMSDERNIEDA